MRQSLLLVLFAAFLSASSTVHAFTAPAHSKQAASPAASTETVELPSGTGLYWAVIDPTTWKRLAPIAVEVNSHSASNMAGGVAGSIFYKPRVTFEVPGAHAETRIHGRVEHFFLRLHRGEMDSIDAKMIDVDVVLVRAHVQKDRRVLVKENYSGITGKPSARNENEVPTLQSEVGSGEWTEITPSAPLDPGEYALVFLPKEKQWNTRFVLDFGIDP